MVLMLKSCPSIYLEYPLKMLTKACCHPGCYMLRLTNLIFLDTVTRIVVLTTKNTSATSNTAAFASTNGQGIAT
jgi:hypothetical protein